MLPQSNSLTFLLAKYLRKNANSFRCSMSTTSLVFGKIVCIHLIFHSFVNYFFIGALEWPAKNTMQIPMLTLFGCVGYKHFSKISEIVCYTRLQRQQQKRANFKSFQIQSIQADNKDTALCSTLALALIKYLSTTSCWQWLAACCTASSMQWCMHNFQFNFVDFASIIACPLISLSIYIHIHRSMMSISSQVCWFCVLFCCLLLCCHCHTPKRTFSPHCFG